MTYSPAPAAIARVMADLGCHEIAARNHLISERILRDRMNRRRMRDR